VDQKSNPCQTLQNHTRIFLSSLQPEEKARGSAAAREHWSSKTAIIINATLPHGRKIVTGIEGPAPL